MEPGGIGMAGLAAALALAGLGIALRLWRRRRQPRWRSRAQPPAGPVAAGPSEARLQAVAGQILGLLQSSGPALEAARAGIAALEIRVAALETWVAAQRLERAADPRPEAAVWALPRVVSLHPGRGAVTAA